MAWRGWPAALLLVPLLVASAPGEATACSPTRILQDDAKLGADAPDARAQAAVLRPERNETEVFEYFWGWLDPPTGAPGADAADWYGVDVRGRGETVMLSLISNYTARMEYYGDFTLHLYPPGSSQPVASATALGGEVIEFVNFVPGVWSFRISAGGGEGSCGPTLPSVASPLARNHGVYFGCKPVCLGPGSI